MVAFDPSNRILVDSIEFVSPAALRVKITAAANALTGKRNVIASNPDGGQAIVTDGFEIMAAVDPKNISGLITIYPFPNPVNANQVQNIIMQLNWPAAAAQVKCVFVGDGGIYHQPPFQANVVPGINNILVSTSTQLGHRLPNGIHLFQLIYGNKIVAKAKVTVANQ